MVVAVLVFILNIEQNKYPLEHSNFYIVYFFLIYDDFFKKKKNQGSYKELLDQILYISLSYGNQSSNEALVVSTQIPLYSLLSSSSISLSISNILVLFASGSLHIFSYATKRR